MKKNKDFFFLQYNKINWKNQEKTKINSFINDYIIKNVILKHSGENVSIFDIGFGIGFFIKMLAIDLFGKYKKINIEGCEPSKVNFDYFNDQKLRGVDLKLYPYGFLEMQTEKKFDFITAIYVFPHFLFDDLEEVIKKINLMLNKDGKFILVLANDKYLQEKLDNEKDLFIEKEEIEFRGKIYKETLHYTDIPEIGKVIDYNREESLYVDMFKNNGISVKDKQDLNDNGFICSILVFIKN